ncbi:FCD domain-containing protein [Vibrio hippocampi]|uniref:HTH-type transcriptional regulator LutR n=1 Tax=Vibrio hippocampi TaxID=654686 RepID=A0ABM8ZN40_9VIBR|nr:FCD domain-containing protein [Vibrio hippocampi]CAH0529993.1 HTH-type transcriptional regulator LutR [Vibrio hippocampi]
MINFEPKRSYQTIGLILRQELSDGMYPIGSRLPPERDIAERLNVGRTVVREAIIMLELENLVDVKKGSGVYVINLPQDDLSQGNLPQSKHSQSGSGSARQEDVGPFEMLQARQLLESTIAEFAAVQATPSDIARMREALEIEKNEINSDDDLEPTGDKLFHFYIAEATQNSILVDMFKQLWERRESSPMWQKLHCHIENKDYCKEWLDDHAQILLAMQRKDPSAAKHAMWQHLENVKIKLLELSDFEDPQFDGYLFESIPAKLVLQKK